MNVDAKLATAASAAMVKPPKKKAHVTLPYLVENLQRIMAEQNINALNLSKAAGLGGTTVFEILRGHNRNPSLRVLISIATALRVDIRSLVDPPGTLRDATQVVTPHASSSLVISQIPVLAMAAETGVLRAEPSGKPGESRTIVASLHPQLPHAQHFSLLIRDTAMDAAKPAFAPGSFALCIDMETSKLVVESGKIYAVRFWHDVSGTRHSEILIRRAQVFSDRVELIAETHRGAFPKVIVPEKLTSDPEAPVHAFGQIYASVDFV